MDFDKLFGITFEDDMRGENDAKMKTIECRNLISEKFGNIDFVEESHRYTIGGNEFIPVSNVIKMYEPEVDWDKKAEDYARKYGKKKEDVQREWKLNNLKATISGTRTHEFGESYTNILCGHPELICEQNKPQYIKEFGVLVPTYPKEESIKKFYDSLEPNLHPVGAEFKLSSIYMENTLPICGTCDLLFYDSDRKGYVIGDWKTNKSLIKEYSRDHNITMTRCLSNLIDEPLSHYRVQMSMYQVMLESIGLKICDRFIVWLKDDGSYEKIYVEKIDDKVLNKILKGEK